MKWVVTTCLGLAVIAGISATSEDFLEPADVHERAAEGVLMYGGIFMTVVGIIGSVWHWRKR